MRNRIVPILAVAVIGLSACSDSDYQNRSAATAPPAAGGPTDFTSFVLSQYSEAAQSPTALPVQVDAVSFSFVDNENPTAFNSIIAVAP